MARCSDSSYRTLAARSLRKYSKQLAEQLRSVRVGEDVEAVHRARVATRRLRAALAVFRPCWKRKQVKSWKKEIRRLARSLGEARDQDVLIEFLASTLAATDPALRAGITSLLRYVQRQRQWLQPRVLKAIDRIEASGLLKEFQAAVRPILEEAGDAEIAPSDFARLQAGKNIRKRLKKLIAEAAGLGDPEEFERHHAMRIAAKRLRYTLELARPVFTEVSAIADAAEATEMVKRLQTFLGEIHDCDVWMERIAEFAQRECGMGPSDGDGSAAESLPPALEQLRADRRARRRQVFGELQALWQSLLACGIWERLAETVAKKAATETGP